MVTPEVVGHIDPACLVELRDEREARNSARRAGRRGDRDPAHPAVSGVVADLKGECVEIAGQGGVRIVMREEGPVPGDVHGGHASCGS